MSVSRTKLPTQCKDFSLFGGWKNVYPCRRFFYVGRLQLVAAPTLEAKRFFYVGRLQLVAAAGWRLQASPSFFWLIVVKLCLSRILAIASCKKLFARVHVLICLSFRRLSQFVYRLFFAIFAVCFLFILFHFKLVYYGKN